MNTILHKRIGGMRAILPLAILVVPGAAYAQSADPVLPSTIAQWSDERIVPAAGLAQFVEPISPAVLLAEPADDALAASPLPTVAFAEAGPADIVVATTDAADTELAAGQPLALADQATTMFGASPVAESELADTKGKALGDNAMVAIVNANANINNNYIGANGKTGNISISDTAFSNVSGFALVNVNTGNQSIITSGMSVVLQINYASQ